MKVFSIMFVVGLVVLAGCGRKGKKEQVAEEERIKQLGDKAEVLVDSSKLSDADRLLGLLPKVVANMKRLGKPEAKKMGPIGRRLSRAEVAFEGAEGEHVEMSITDAVSPKGFAAIPEQEWLTKDVKEDTDTKFVSVDKKDGRRMYKEYNSNSRKAVVRVLVGDRFVVEVMGMGMNYEPVEALLSHVDIATLEKMAAKK